MTKQTAQLAALVGIACGLAVVGPRPAQADRVRRPRSEVIAWTADAQVVVFTEPNRRSRRRVDVVARRVPNGRIVARASVYPGPCGRVIDGRIAIEHACALARLRPRLPERYQDRAYHIAANERHRIRRLTVRADGSIVEHELPGLGLVLRGHTEEESDDRMVAVLEVMRQGRPSGRVLDRQPVRERARKRWVLLQAGDGHVIVVAPGLLHKLSPPRARPSSRRQGVAADGRRPRRG